eukprot:scaffold3058_cov177-Amphora_coffeaeformis.AAC.10
MEHIASSMGLGFLNTSARKAVMKRARPGTAPQEFPASFKIPHRDSLLGWKQASSMDDDDTMSTMSSSSSDISLGSRGASVTFSYQLVTEIHTRPRTTDAEKLELFYQDSDYRQFRYEYIYGRRAQKRVNFSTNLVSGVWAYEKEGENSSLYYNQADLQR